MVIGRAEPRTCGRAALADFVSSRVAPTGTIYGATARSGRVVRVEVSLLGSQARHRVNGLEAGERARENCP